MYVKTCQSKNQHKMGIFFSPFFSLFSEKLNFDHELLKEMRFPNFSKSQIICILITAQNKYLRDKLKKQVNELKLFGKRHITK